MHIAHVNLAKGFSGGERQTLNLISTLAEHGIKQTVVLRPDSPMHQELDCLPVTTLNAQHMLRGHSSPWTNTPGGRPDLLHAHDGKAVYWCYTQHKLNRLPYVITRRVDNSLKKKWLTGAAYRTAETVICLSQAIQAAVKKRSSQIRTQIIPSSFSLLAHDPAHTQAIRQSHSGSLLVGQVGKLIEHKGFHITIEAARLLEKTHPKVKFLFLGQGDKEAELKQQAAGLSNLEFLGHQQAISDYIAALDILVFPSLSEGLGSTILEAMALKVPVIGSEAGGIPDMVSHRKTGLLVPPGDAQALADAVVELAETSQLREQLVQQACDQLPNFSPASVAERYLALYRSLI